LALSLTLRCAQERAGAEEELENTAASLSEVRFALRA
jgi:hypothetical protein